MDRFDYGIWLREFKYHIAMAQEDDSKNEMLKTYLYAAHKHIWDCYYRIGEFELLETKEHPWFTDQLTKLATFHTATTLVTNPDINLEARDVKDERMIFRILGSRVNYGVAKEIIKKYYTVEEIDKILLQYYTIPQVDQIANNLDQKISDWSNKTNQNENNIATNLAQIDNNKKAIELLIEENKKQINLVNEIQAGNSYEKGDQGFIGVQWYLCLVDGALGSEVNDNTKWKKINFQTSADLSDYYTKSETNQLLGPLEVRLNSIEQKDQSQDTEIALKADKTYVDQQIANIPGMDLTNYYNKQETEALIDPIEVDVEQNKNNIQTNTQSIDTLTPQVEQNKNDIVDINNRIDNLPKVDLTNYYNKQEIDTSQEAQNLKIDNNQSLINQNIQDIGTKANINDVYNKTEVFNKQEMNNAFPTYIYLRNNHYNKTEIDTSLNAKANANEVYSKTESDGKYLKFNDNNSGNRSLILGWNNEQKIALIPEQLNVNSTITNRVGELHITTGATNKRMRIAPSGNLDLEPATGKQVRYRNQEVATKQFVTDQIGGIRGLVNGDNITLQDQGTNEKFINVVDNIKVNEITARANNVLKINSETHFEDIPHMKSGLIIEHNNQSSQIAQLNADLKIINDNGDILLVDKVGAFNPRETKTLLTQVVDQLKTLKPFSYKGDWTQGVVYKQNDLVTNNKQEYLSLINNNTNPTTDTNSWLEFGPEIDLSDYYNKTQIDGLQATQDANITTNTNNIADLQRRHQLDQQRIDKIDQQQKFTIDPAQSNDWELNLLFSELDPSDATKSTIKMVPSDLKEYQLKQTLKSQNEDLELVKGELKDILVSTNKDTIKQLYYGQESKNPIIAPQPFYGYSPVEWPQPIPLEKQVGVATFGNIFDVDYQQWNGVFYKGTKIAWGTSDGGIDLRNSKFKANVAIENITLYKEVVNDGVTKTYVDTQLALKANLTANTFNGNQSINGQVKARENREALRIDAKSGNEPVFIAVYNGEGTRIGRIGKNGNSNIIEIVQDTNNDIFLTTKGNGKAKYNGNEIATVNQVNVIPNGNNKPFGTVIKAGHGGGIVSFSPEDNSNKILKFSNSTVGANCKFKIDLENKIDIINLKNPTNANDATNKTYVDTQLAGKVNANDVYTKTQSDQKYALLTMLDTKANDNQVVKLTGNQTINGNKTFNGETGFGDGKAIRIFKNGNNGEIASNTGNIRIVPVGGGYTDFANRKLINVPNPTANNEAANKQYVDTQVNTKTTVKLNKREGPLTINASVTVIDTNDRKKVISINVYRRRNDGTTLHVANTGYQLIYEPTRIRIYAENLAGWQNYFIIETLYTDQIGS